MPTVVVNESRHDASVAEERDGLEKMVLSPGL
jgi:hypothetical protein